MTFTSAAVFSIAIVLIALYLKTQQKEIAVLFVTAGTLLLFLTALGTASEAIGVIRDMVAESKYSAEVETMLKAFGIAAAAQITADVCRGAGEMSVAAQIELVAKAEIVVLALPLAARLLTVARELLS